MKRKIEEFFKRFIVLKTRKKLRIIIVVGLVVEAVKLIFCDFQQSKLILKFDTINVELGQTVSANIDSYLDKNKLSNKVVKKIIKETEEKDNLKYVKVINKDENGNKKIVITKKSNNQVFKTDAIASTSPVSNTGTVKSDTANTKPTTNTGSSTLAPSNNSSGSSN